MYTTQRIFFIGILAVIATPLLVGAALYRDLSLGAQGQDVLELQQLLNARPETQIAQSGPGSPGNETTFFGSLTHAAVVRYQNLYTQSILLPLGLFSGTGYVGASTRAHLVGGAVNPPVSAQVFHNLSSTKGTTGTGTLVDTGAPVISSVEPSRGPVGTKITLHGRFDLEGNTVYPIFGDVEDLSSDGETISFVLVGPFPSNFDIPDFVRAKVDDIGLPYGFYVENNNGRSNAIPFTIDL